MRGAEEIVGVLQTQMQALQAEKEQAVQKVEEMRAVMGKGKWVERANKYWFESASDLRVDAVA